MDWGILAAGLLALIFSFFSYYTASVDFGGGIGSRSESASAWREIFGGGFFGWFGMLLTVAGAVVFAIALFQPSMRLPLPARALSFLLYSLGVLFNLLAIVAHPKFYDADGLSLGHGFSFWVILILSIVGAVLSFLRVKQTNTPLPGPLASLTGGGSSTPQGGPGSFGPPPGGGYNQPPPGGGYGPPPGGGFNPPPPGGGYNPPPPQGYGPPQ